MTVNIDGESQTLIEDQQKRIDILEAALKLMNVTADHLQERIAELEADKANILANTDKSALRLVNLNTELQAQVKELEAAPIKINVKSRDVWITFNAGEGRQAMLCLNNIIKDMHNEGITKGICLDAIRAALQEKNDGN